MSGDDRVPSDDRANQVFAEARRVLAAGAADALSAGVRELERAAELGSGEAVAQLAHFLAAGVTGKPDWDRSVDLLQRSAELGCTRAREELQLLARGAGDTLAAMRGHVDIRAWVAPRPSRIVSEAPRIRTVASFMSAEECAWMIELGRPKLKPAAVYDNEAGGARIVSVRTNSAADIGPLEVDLVSVFLHARMANSLGVPSQWFEPMAILHYEPGQQFEPHVDFLDPSRPGQAADMNQRGQRVATLLVYLNDDYDGGETEFPRIGYRFKGRTGDALVFANVDASNAPDQRTLHAGLPPTRGEKWLLSQWIRNRPAV
jgi:hypothetical protein